MAQVKNKEELLKLLTYEVVKGKPVYYRGYKEVLEGKKTLEEVMGSSMLQGLIVALIVSYLAKKLNLSKYLIATNEVGVFTSENSWRTIDIGIFDVENVVWEDTFSKRPPKVVIEVDTKADPQMFGSYMDYIYAKTDDLLNAGVERVIWIFTPVKKVMEATKEEDWRIKDWNKEVEVIDGIKLSVGKLLEETQNK
ncbi:MAG: Uma2 family endonuclease [Aquificae bacterium]|nr:Uma2 family endonuclease [Aquificota bacterium]